VLMMVCCSLWLPVDDCIWALGCPGAAAGLHMQSWAVVSLSSCRVSEDALALHCCQAAGMTWRQLALGAEAM